jgi:hypothetical protein
MTTTTAHHRGPTGPPRSGDGSRDRSAIAPSAAARSTGPNPVAPPPPARGARRSHHFTWIASRPWKCAMPRAINRRGGEGESNAGRFLAGDPVLIPANATEAEGL